jgi:hypothetical protein
LSNEWTFSGFRVTEVVRIRISLFLKKFKQSALRNFFAQIQVLSGTDVMILKIFSPKNLANILALFAQTTASFGKNVIRTLVFEKNVNYFFAENRQKIEENCDHNIDPSCLKSILRFLNTSIIS